MNDIRKRTHDIHQFIITRIETHPESISQITAQKFNITRQTVNRHLKALAASGQLIASGNTRARIYILKPFIQREISLPVTPQLQEDVIWREHIVNYLHPSLPKNINEICHYAFTEMTNNVIEHSESARLKLVLRGTATKLTIQIVDNGIGIFKKLQMHFGLEDPRHAILELAKGKLTTDPKRHTGEGIFFASRMFDRFSIMANGLAYLRFKEDDWLVESQKKPDIGTSVSMEISLKSNVQIADIFNRYTSDENYGFTKTIIPVALAQYGDELLVSRSQGKRLVARFERFQEVLLDFKGITIIGQAFADEIFRVFCLDHPTVHIAAINANPEIEQMIRRAESHKQTDTSIKK